MDRREVRTGVALVLSLVLTAMATQAEPPTFTFFYGKGVLFRSIGVPQRCANVLGNVQDPDGISSLTCTINGGAVRTLSLGPDTRRLLNAGDFNIDIPWSQLVPLPDSNFVVITATDTQSEVSRDTVIVAYYPDRQWPLPTSVVWSEYSKITNAGQIVDGQWAFEGSAVRNIDIGYDRLLAIGDTTWTDYEITVPITVHSIDPGGYLYPSGQPVVGLFVRWIGHTDDPNPGWQPLSGWNPSGALGMYAFNAPQNGGERLEFWQRTVDLSGKKLTLGETYYFKIRVESMAEGDHYALRVWPVGGSEPSVWDVVYLDTARRISHGSALLLAHHVDATFGDVVVTAPGDLPVQLAEFTAVALSETAVRLDWRTLSETSNYGFEVERAGGEPVGFSIIPGSFTAGHATTLEPQTYTFVDSAANPGVWYYRLRQIDLDGSIGLHEPVRVVVAGTTSALDARTPSGIALLQNYPNPFNPTTTLRFTIAGVVAPSGSEGPATKVRLAIYDLLGREVALLVDEQKTPGYYEATWDASRMASGVYYARLTAYDKVFTTTMLLAK